MRVKILKNDQSGLASIMIVVVIIALLSLITVGFAQLMDKDYHQSTDRELASQASYAAESGLNDARAYVIGQIDNGADPNSLSTPPGHCMDLSTPHPPLLLNGQISGYYHNSSTDNVVKYTCVIINTAPKDIRINPVKQNQSVVLKMVPQGTAQGLYFSWDNAAITPGNIALGPSLPEEPSVSASQIGMLRVTIYPALNNCGGNCDAAVASASRTYFLYANNAGAGSINSFNYSSTNGTEEAGNCNAANRSSSVAVPDTQAHNYACNARITGVDAVGASFYYVRITALYQDLQVGVQASDNTGAAVKIGDAQALLDVTGEGNNVLKRLQGRLALTSDLSLPNYTLQSMDTICKRQRLPKTGPGSYGSSTLDDPAGNVDSACQPPQF